MKVKKALGLAAVAVGVSVPIVYGGVYFAQNGITGEPIPVKTLDPFEGLTEDVEIEGNSGKTAYNSDGNITDN